jgi:peptidoglycan glycosyltransferase
VTSTPTPAPKRRHRFRRFVAPLLVVLALLIAALFVVAWLPLRNARDLWKRGANAEAIERAERWSKLRLWPKQYHQLLAASYLSIGNAANARVHLDAIRGSRLWVGAVAKEDVARKLFAGGRYADFIAYDDASKELSEKPDVRLYRAAALAATNRIDEAEAIARHVDSSVDPKKLAALQTSITMRRGGLYPLVVDRNGGAIASYHVANRDLVAIDSRFSPLIEKEAGPLTIESHIRRLGVNDTIETTLDPEVQGAALAALGGFRGSLVAIDPRTNEILAIASNRGNGPLKNLALESQNEPGSIIKVLTGLNAYASGVDVTSMFPYHCTGDLMIDGRHFGDWMATGHGDLPAFDDALAQSCNIFFADIGLRLGVDNLRKFMISAGFDGKVNLGVFEAPLGKIIPPIFNKYETAFLAIGLEHESINALHVAVIASMIANRGVMTQPRFLRGRRSILGEVVTEAERQGSTRIAPADATEKIVRAMVAVASSEHGTGRRAPVEGITLAMKTGTAGSRDKGGLEALILAFAPAENPKIAFGIIAEDAGPAEFAGAKIAHAFLAAMKGRL